MSNDSEINILFYCLRKFALNDHFSHSDLDIIEKAMKDLREENKKLMHEGEEIGRELSKYKVKELNDILQKKESNGFHETDMNQLIFIKNDSKAEDLIMELIELGHNHIEVCAFMCYLDAIEAGEYT